MKKSLIVFAAMALAGGGASAATGTLTVTGTVVGSVTMAITPAFGTVSGSGTNASTAALGDVSKYGPVPAGFTRTQGASNYTFASTISVTVMQANSSSNSATLFASLATAPYGVQWYLEQTPLGTSDTNITGALYGQARDLSFSLVIPSSGTFGALDNTINITAVASLF